MNEFSLIEKYLAPLAKGHKGAFSLTDDAALIAPKKGYEIIITKDAIASGVHFLPLTPPELIARKLLRTNLSDIAAMGGNPKYYLIAAMLTAEINEDWIKKFSSALAEEQKIFGVHLIGGDTIKHNGPLAFSLTMIGEVARGKALRRNGAKPGDDIYVSGTLGDSALGLKILRGELDGPEYLTGRYHIPEPRIELGQKLAGIATSCMDISDGLIADLGHICDASEVSAIVEKEKIPLSAPVRKIIKNRPDLWELSVSSGDDYELLFTAPAAQEKRLKTLATELRINLTKIGNITKKNRKKSLIMENGCVISLKNQGYRHF